MRLGPFGVGAGGLGSPGIPKKNLPYGSGPGLATLAAILASTASVGIICNGDSKTESVQPPTPAGLKPTAEAWTVLLQRSLDSGKSKVFDVPISYNPGTGLGPMPGVVVGASGPYSYGIDRSAQVPNSTYPGYIAYYFAEGLSHVAICLGTNGSNGTFFASVYTGDVTGAVPTYGTTTNRVANMAHSGLLAGKGTVYASSFAKNDWGQDVNAKDQAGVEFKAQDNMLFVVAENVDMGVSTRVGCTVVFYAGNNGNQISRIIGKIGGATFQENYRAVLNLGSYGLDAGYYYSATAASAVNDYFGPTLGHYRFGQALRFDKTKQPWTFGSTNIVADLGRKAAFDKIVVIHEMYTNRTTVPPWATITGPQMASEVAAIVALADRTHALGGVFIFFELNAIFESTSGAALTNLTTFMGLVKTAMSTHPAGIFLSVAEFLVDRDGITIAQARQNDWLATNYGTLLVRASAGDAFHTANFWAQNVEAKAVIGLFDHARLAA